MSEKKKCRDITKSALLKNHRNSSAHGLAVCFTQKITFLTHHWNWMVGYEKFWKSSLFSMLHHEPILVIFHKALLGISLQFSFFWPKILLFMYVLIIKNTIANLSPNMINFDVLDFGECCCKVVLSLYFHFRVCSHMRIKLCLQWLAIGITDLCTGILIPAAVPVNQVQSVCSPTCTNMSNLIGGNWMCGHNKIPWLINFVTKGVYKLFFFLLSKNPLWLCSTWYMHTLHNQATCTVCPKKNYNQTFSINIAFKL